jgi:coenzyme F420 hydrogenase subunit beta
MNVERGELYAGYAAAAVRDHAASGGIVSAILIGLLRQGVIDGALVSRIESVDNRIVAQTRIACTVEDILRHGGSSYIDTPVLQRIHELQGIEGRYAVVMLPCQVRAFVALARRNPQLRQTFSPVIALFCRGTVSAEFYADYLRRLKIAPETVETIKVKREYVGGSIQIHRRDQSKVEVPFVQMNSYRQAGFHSKRLCAWCTEHLGLEADISVGDIFMPEYRSRPIKHSAFTGHTELGRLCLQTLIDSGEVTAERVGWAKYQQKFAKVEAMSNTLASRFQAARLIGQPHPRTPGADGGRFNFFHMLAWLLIYSNGRFSRSQWGRKIIYGVPPVLVVLYNLIIKGFSKL